MEEKDFIKKIKPLPEEINNIKKIISEEKILIKISSDDFSSYSSLGNLYKKINKYDFAEKMYKKEIELYPDNPQYLDYLGCLYTELEKYDDALKLYIKTRELNPDNPDYIGAVAYLHAKLKHYDEAIKEYEKFIEINDKYIVRLVNYIQLLFITQKSEKISKTKEKIFSLIKNKDSFTETEKISMLEFYFYLYMHEENQREDNYEKIIELLKRGIRSEDWELSDNIKLSEKTHPDIVKVKILAEIINNRKPLNELNNL